MHIERIWAPSQSSNGEWTTRVRVVDQEKYDGGPVKFGSDWEPGTLDEVIGALVAIRETIPDEYRSTAMCEISSGSGYDGTNYPRVVVAYTRPSTDEEIASMTAKMEAEEAARTSEARRQYEALKARFG